MYSFIIPVLTGGYKEAEMVSLDDPFPPHRQSLTEEYEYMSDSDLEDEEEGPSTDDASKEAPIEDNVNALQVLALTVDDTVRPVSMQCLHYVA